MTDLLRKVNPIVWIVILSLLVTGCSLASEPVPMGPVQRGPLPDELPQVPAQAPRLANGMLIFAEHCAECHGLTGDGVGTLAAELEANGAEVPVLADPDLAAQRSPAEWFTRITNGTIQMGGLMPPWRNSLTPEERWDVTYFLYSLSVPPDQLELAAVRFDDLAAQCGEGEADPPDLADTASQSPRMLLASYLDSSADCIDSAALSDDEAYALAVYLLTLPADSTPHAAIAAEPQIEVANDEVQVEESESLPEDVSETASDRGIIDGTVMLNETGQSSPVSIEVTLEGLALDTVDNFQQIHTGTVMTDDTGNFVFEDLPWDIPQSAYIVTVQYDGIEYGNGIILDGSTNRATLPITVYGRTSDPSVVRLDSMHMYAQPREDGLLVSEILVFSNISDTVYVADEASTGQQVAGVAVALPEGAAQIEFQDNAPGQQFVFANGQYYDTQPLYPGEATQTILVEYVLPGVDRYDFDVPVLYDSSVVTVIVDQAHTIQSANLDEGQPSDLNGQSVTVFQGGNLQSDETLSFRLRPRRRVGSFLPLVLGIVVVGGGALLLRQRNGVPAVEYAPADHMPADALIRQVIQLDADFDAGLINRIDYEAERAQLCYEIAIAGDA